VDGPLVYATRGDVAVSPILGWDTLHGCGHGVEGYHTHLCPAVVTDERQVL
jgi:hypothetical protein